MKLSHGSWTAIGIPLIYLGALVLALATVEIVFHIAEKYYFVFTVILACLLRNSINTGFPGYGSFELSSIGMGTAYAFTMLAISQIIGKKKRWNAAWIILSFATLCHVHEGIWGFCIIFIIYLCQTIKEKSLGIGKRHWAFIVFVITMGICIVPGVFGKSSGISSSEFVDIYAYFRHPHHLVPSAWGFSSILKYFCLILGTVVLRLTTIYYTNKDKLKDFLWEAGLALASWIGALAVVYIFTEVFPVSAISTMYIPKYFKYVGILSQIWCVKNIRDWINSDEFLLAVSSLITVLAASSCSFMGVALFYVIAVAGIILIKKCDVKEMRIILPICILMLIETMNIFSVTICVVFIFVIYLVVLWDRVVCIQKIIKSTAFVAAFSILVLGFATKDRLWSYDGLKISRVTASSYLVRSTGQDLYDLGQEFKQTTDNDVTFLTDPNVSTGGWFQLISERNCYAVVKVVPSVQNQIKEWYERILKTQGLFEKSMDEIAEIMKQENLDYILVKNDYYEKFDSTDIFKIRNTSPNDEYRIYEIR